MLERFPHAAEPFSLFLVNALSGKYYVSMRLTRSPKPFLVEVLLGFLHFTLAVERHGREQCGQRSV